MPSCSAFASSLLFIFSTLTLASCFSSCSATTTTGLGAHPDDGGCSVEVFLLTEPCNGSCGLVTGAGTKAGADWETQKEEDAVEEDVDEENNEDDEGTWA